MKILTVVDNGFEETEAITVIDILRRAQLTVDVYALHGNSVTGSHGMVMADLATMDKLQLDDYQAFFIGGGRQYKSLEADSHFQELVTHFMKANLPVAAICAAPTILGRAGWLKGRNYTCFTKLNEEFGGTYHDVLVYQDGQLLTGRSLAASLDFALAWVKKLAGDEAEQDVRKRIYYPQ